MAADAEVNKTWASLSENDKIIVMERDIRKGVRGLYLTEGTTLSDSEVVKLTNILIRECVRRDLPRTNIWKIIITDTSYPNSIIHNWIQFSLYRPRVDDVFSGTNFDPTTHVLDIEGPLDFFREGVQWPWKKVVFGPEARETAPIDTLPARIDASNYGDYLNAC